MIFGLGHYLHAAILRSIFRTMIFCPMDRINCRCKSPFTTFDEKKVHFGRRGNKIDPAAALHKQACRDVILDQCRGRSRWVGSKISRSNGRKGGGGDLRKEKEEGILTEGRIEGWTDGWMRFDSAGWIFVWFHRRRGPRCQTTKGFFEQILLVVLFAVFSPSPSPPLDILPVFGKGQIANCVSVWERRMKGSPE